MSRHGDTLANAAEALAGTRFRLHGRDRVTGLDCIGLVGAALADCGRTVRYPRGYRLRNADIGRWFGFAADNGLRSRKGAIQRGDVLLTRPGPAQHHLLVSLGDARFVHAHAGLRQVVIQQLIPLDPILAQWRIGPNPEQSWQP